MSETFPISGEQNRTAGGLIIVLISFLSAVLVVAGLMYAAGTSERHRVALASAGCEPNLSPSGLQCTTAHVLVREYATITTPVIQQVLADAAAYSASERHRLAAAEAALTAEVTSENALGRSLTRFPFPPAVAPIAKALIRADRACARLTAEQARSSSLAQMRSFNGRIKAASAAVETDMALVRKALDTRPTASQEP